MSRKGSHPARLVLPDPKHGSQLIARFINMVMKSGKKSVSSRFLAAPPRLSDASSSSAASLRGIEVSPRLRAASMTQRIASAMRRPGRTSTGTW